MRAILDANLLIVLLVGLCDKGKLGKKKCVREYDEDDYLLLLEVLGRFGEVLVTPNIVTECSNNLCGRTDHGENAPESRMLAQLLEEGRIGSLRERYVPSCEAARRAEYSYLGVADCSLLHLVDARCAVVTADGALARAAQSINPASVNFNHERSAAAFR